MASLVNSIKYLRMKYQSFTNSFTKEKKNVHFAAQSMKPELPWYQSQTRTSHEKYTPMYLINIDTKIVTKYYKLYKTDSSNISYKTYIPQPSRTYLINAKVL